MREDSRSGAAALATADESSASRGSGRGAKIAPRAEALGVSFGVESEDDEGGRGAAAPIVKSWSKTCSVLNWWASPESSRGTSGGACRSPSAGEVVERAESIGKVGEEGEEMSALSRSCSSCVRFGSIPEVGEVGSMARKSDTGLITYV